MKEKVSETETEFTKIEEDKIWMVLGEFENWGERSWTIAIQRDERYM